MNLMKSILDTKVERPLRILTSQTHESYETSLAQTNAHFFAPNFGFKSWKTEYRPVPKNYTIFPTSNIPFNVDFDLVLSQNKFDQFGVLSKYAKAYKVPLISLEHTLPIHSWSHKILRNLNSMRGDINVFISEYSAKQWGYSFTDNSVRVIHHGIDTEQFKPTDQPRENRILCVVNDWINRDYCCNFSGFIRTASNLPCYILGNTPGLSQPAKSVEELISAYQNSRIFYNTSTVSPIPTALLEAAACGCAIVSTATCMIPEIITHGVNGFISNDEQELSQYLNVLLREEKLAIQLGQNARKTILEKFSLKSFVDNWNNIFAEAAKLEKI